MEKAESLVETLRERWGRENQERLARHGHKIGFRITTGERLMELAGEGKAVWVVNWKRTSPARWIINMKFDWVMRWITSGGLYEYDKTKKK